MASELDLLEYLLEKELSEQASLAEESGKAVVCQLQ